jgi:hypothetical protein
MTATTASLLHAFDVCHHLQVDGEAGSSRGPRNGPDRLRPYTTGRGRRLREPRRGAMAFADGEDSAFT